MEYLSATMTSARVTSGFGVLALLLSVLAFLPYVRDTLERKTQPQRASWIIWSTLSLIAFFTQVAEGATASLWFIGAQCVCTVSIFLLSIWYGSGSYLSRHNLTIFVAAGVGLSMWYALDEAVYALAITLLISALAGYATARKAYREPESETLSTWVMLVAASICGVVSVGIMNWMHLAYPVYLLGLYVTIVLAVLLGYGRAIPAIVPEVDGPDCLPVEAATLVCTTNRVGQETV